MKRMLPSFQLKTIEGEASVVQDARITPISQAFIVRLPFYRFVYHRPLAVLYEKDGQSQRVPVIDVTRLLLIGLAAVGILIPVIAAVSMRQQKDQTVTA